MCPRVSVIMSVYNSEKYLEDSIKSILNQSFKDFEFIIVNDCSNDNSLKIINKYKENDVRIKLINNSKKINLANSLNKCLKVAKGKYIARMDADDISIKNRLEIQYNFMEENEDIFLCGGSAIVINEYGKKEGKFLKYDSPSKIKRKLLNSNPLIHPSIFFRNTKDLFYRGEFELSQDYDFYLRILESHRKIINISNLIIMYRVYKENEDKIKKQRYYFNKAKEFYLQRKKTGQDDYPDFNDKQFILENMHIDVIRIGIEIKISIKFQDNQMKEARKEIKRYFNQYGFNKRFVAYYILSFFPFKLISLFRKF